MQSDISSKFDKTLRCCSFTNKNIKDKPQKPGTVLVNPFVQEKISGLWTPHFVYTDSSKNRQKLYFTFLFFKNLNSEVWKRFFLKRKVISKRSESTFLRKILLLRMAQIGEKIKFSPIFGVRNLSYLNPKKKCPPKTFVPSPIFDQIRTKKNLSHR